MKGFRSAFYNFQCDIDELIDDGMRVAVRWTWTGRKLEFTETHLLRTSGDRIVEDHVSANLVDLLNQLGTAQFAEFC
jgi:predicted ester cyclase